jgi:hypothetical protein
MIFSGDMKLIDDMDKIRKIKDLDHMNRKLEEVHGKYYLSIEAFRNGFICSHDLDNFDFRKIPIGQRMEFWNRINFLKANVKYYHDALLMAQSKYNEFLFSARK